VSTDTSRPTTFTTITAYLSWDHHRLDVALEAAAARVEAGDMPGARRAFAEYDRGLARHIRLEEELLFPLFEAKSGMVGPTAVMRDEHRSIRTALAMMRSGLEGDDARAFQGGRRFLETVLPEHDAKEEHILYPTTDRLLSEAERARLTASLVERE
jgi:hemerythrin-like domain-containing protein